jgi:hypothetical protein
MVEQRRNRRIQVSLPPELDEALKEWADDDGRNLSGLIVWLATRAVKERAAKAKK